jgi:hypothetical protein
LTLGLIHDFPQQPPRYSLAAKITVNGDIVNVDSAGEEPEKHVADYLSVRFGENRASAGDLQFLAKKTGAPGKRKRGFLDRHNFIEVGGDHRAKLDAPVRRKKATGVILSQWLAW